MRCAFCHSEQTQVVETRLSEPGAAVRRRRSCPSCERRFTTYERFEGAPLWVVKRDGSRQPFDSDKLLRGLHRAANKRPIDPDDLDKLANSIESELGSEGRSTAAERIGQLALRGLRDIDGVAYVRFASVYRKFESAEEFAGELAHLETDDVAETPSP